MKNFKKVIGVVLALAIVVTCFAACGGNTDNSGKTSDKIVVGGTGPLTGDASSYGISVQQGAQLAIDEINAAGGMNGIQLEFIMKDDKATAAETATAYDQLMDAGMQISIGATTTGSCEAFAASVIEGRKNAFRVCFGDPDQGVLAADTLVNDYKMKNIGCIYDTSDTYSSGIYDAFKSEMEKLGVSFTTKTFDKENNKDFSTQVEALKDCDVIFTPFYYTEAGLVARACSAKGVNALIFGCDGLDGVAGQVDSTVTNEIKYITPFDVNSTDETISKFVASYKAKYSTTPDQFAADAYDAVYVIYNAMLKANITDANISASELCDKVAAVLTGGMEFTGTTGTMTWSADGAPNKTPTIVTVEK